MPLRLRQHRAGRRPGARARLLQRRTLRSGRRDRRGAPARHRRSVGSEGHPAHLSARHAAAPKPLHLTPPNTQSDDMPDPAIQLVPKVPMRTVCGPFCAANVPQTGSLRAGIDCSSRRCAAPAFLGLARLHDPSCESVRRADKLLGHLERRIDDLLTCSVVLHSRPEIRH